MDKYNDRENIILSLLNEKITVSVEEAVELLGISDSTARRLFTRMETEGKALRVFGGLRLASGGVNEYSFDTLQQKNIEQKQRIAEYAVNLIEPGDILFLDGGTTVLRVAQNLYQKLKSGKLWDVVVITNSLVTLDALAAKCNVLLVGGSYRLRRKDFAGLVSERVIKSLQFSKCFLGADSIDVEDGFMAMDMETASLDETVISRSSKSYVLVDSAKFKVKSLVSYGKLNQVTMVVTDNGLEDEISNKMRDKNVSFALV